LFLTDAVFVATVGVTRTWMKRKRLMRRVLLERSRLGQEVEDDDDEEEEQENESSRPLDEASSFVPWSDFWGGGAS
jgi:hypothetical protein